MDRREFLAGTGAAVAATALPISAPSFAQPATQGARASFQGKLFFISTPGQETFKSVHQKMICKDYVDLGDVWLDFG